MPWTDMFLTIDMFLTLLQIGLSLTTMYLAYVEIQEKFRKRTLIAKEEAKRSLNAIIGIALICVVIQVISYFENKSDKNGLSNNFATLKTNNKNLRSKIDKLEGSVQILRDVNIKLIEISNINLDSTIDEINRSATKLNSEIQRTAEFQKSANDYLIGNKNIPIFRFYVEEKTEVEGGKYFLQPSISNWGTSPLYDVGFSVNDFTQSKNFFLGNINHYIPTIDYKLLYPINKDSVILQCSVYWRGGGYLCYAIAKKIDGRVKIKNSYFMIGKNMFKPFNPLESPYINIPRASNYVSKKDKKGKVLKDLPKFTEYN